MFGIDKTTFKNNFILTIAVTSGLVTIIMAFLATDFAICIENRELSSLLIFTLFNIGIACLISLPKKEILLNVTNTVKAKIFSADILDQKGIIVIPVNEYFDTLVDDIVISLNTLHGKFVKNVFGENVEDLNIQIIDSLKRQNIQSYKNDKRLEGKIDKYPLGTTAIVKKDGKIYFLVALTRFNDNNHAEITKQEYQIVMMELLNHIEQFSQGEIINIPLLGGGHSGVNVSKQKLLEYLLISIILNDKLTLINGLNIVLNQSVLSEVSLNKIKTIFEMLRN